MLVTSWNVAPGQDQSCSTATGCAVIEQLMECRLQQGAPTFRATGQMKVAINPTPALIISPPGQKPMGDNSERPTWPGLMSANCIGVPLAGSSLDLASSVGLPSSNVSGSTGRKLLLW